MKRLHSNSIFVLSVFILSFTMPALAGRDATVVDEEASAAKPRWTMASFGEAVDRVQKYFPVTKIIDTPAVILPKNSGLFSALRRMPAPMAAVLFGRYMTEHYSAQVFKMRTGRRLAGEDLSGRVKAWPRERFEGLLRNFGLTQHELLSHFPYDDIRASRFGKVYGYFPPTFFAQVHLQETQRAVAAEGAERLRRYFQHEVSVARGLLASGVLDQLPERHWAVVADCHLSPNDGALTQARKFIRLGIKLRGAVIPELEAGAHRTLVRQLFLQASNKLAEARQTFVQHILENEGRGLSEFSADELAHYQDLTRSLAQVFSWISYTGSAEETLETASILPIFTPVKRQRRASASDIPNTGHPGTLQRALSQGGLSPA